MQIVVIVALVLVGEYHQGPVSQYDDANYSTINGWSVHGYSEGTRIGYDWYETRAEAEKEKKKMEDIKTTKGKFYDKVEIKPEQRRVRKDGRKEPGTADSARDLLTSLKEAKKAVDKAREVENEGLGALLKAKERQLFDTIKEYKEMVRQSLERIVETKKTLTSGIASQSDIQFEKVNKLIDQYNSEVRGFESVMGKTANFGFTPMARIAKAGNPGTTTASEGSVEKATFYSIYYRDREGDSEWGEWKSMLTTPIGVPGKTYGFESEEEGKSVIDAVVRHREKTRAEFPNARHIDYEYKLVPYGANTSTTNATDNTAYRNTSEGFIRSQGKVIRETVLVFLPNGRYVELYESARQSDYSADKISAWSATVTGKWRVLKENNIIELYDCERKKSNGTVEKVPNYSMYKVVDGNIHIADKTGNAAPMPSYFGLNKNLTQQAVKKASVARLVSSY